ncbi:MULTISPECIES: energy-coupling factor transporter ATPase [Aneurinibacillus]|jgi:energy-coupling factor transport system ATP-binding protein|uniref:Energy-coupling factor transporter ATP-binding protein EcfA2 n=1 Tax=Aneurinibacillus thermoaerophilus TaxID=143495 RepID=A0A1G8C3W6_ANETH|nr:MULTISPECIES: energy-coupling factor transporter ATPase [Aneurinibacillus]AMA74398.1 energy-coupling factor transporter ATPase [Aneurinibacillus sp. XH2]MED0674484.1 energy-coupling factor transporter ATPase [Aneurinibacillus thermoaerophilus]MED0679210.1 energy-coupling factor transporter ATPase [Aneurinibacillus thermoaerophilus]MED0738192.1 energy-coupling factor transporter ATPase [Aneurinibacillus thermoaerophilus]MED0757519.1 energy-coupling factor transporter ATPase [Aneurinibacillus
MDIRLENVSYTYSPGTPFAYQALRDVSLYIPHGRYVAIIGHTGSGKSTFIQLLNGLLQPTEGTMQIGEFTLPAKKKKGLEKLRQQVGLAFQYPEYQLFEETVRKDVAFGLVNMGVPPEMIVARVDAALRLVGLDPEKYGEKSPFALSGGQMRRAALAGVLVMNPKVLILDEPTAGLDPAGHRAILEMIARVHREEKRTTILVTHSMEDAALYADYLYVMNQGRVWMEGTPQQVFQEPEKIQQAGLDLPEITRFIVQFNERVRTAGSSVPPLPLDIFDSEQLADELARRFSRRGGKRR